MNKHQLALNKLKMPSSVDMNEDKAIDLLQELVDLTKSGEYFNKKDLIDELDKVYTVAKKHYYHLIHYADIYRIIEKVVQDE